MPHHPPDRPNRVPGTVVWSLPESNGDAILTIDAPVVRNAVQHLTGEVGSDNFARTAAHAATVAASTIGGPAKPKAGATILAALRGYTLAVWAMVTLLTRRGRLALESWNSLSPLVGCF
jgi:hypothetical protein